MPSPKKISIVENLFKLIAESQNFALVKFEKTKHQSLEKLRKDLKKNQASLKVVKNTLLEKAFNKLEQTNKIFTDLKKKFSPFRENSAVLILKGDWTKGLSSFRKFMEQDKTLSFKFALLDGQQYGDKEVEKIAQLPSKNELIGKIIGSLKSPTTRLVYSLKFNLNKFVYILNQKSKQAN